LEPHAAALDPDCTFSLASAGKFITHIGILQYVDRGLIKLDEPVYKYLPELENLEIISKNTGPDASTKPFTLRPRTKDITTRQLLLHTSGIGYYEHKILQQWRAIVGDSQEKNRLLYESVMPLRFDPGEGWMYGGSVRASQLLLERLSGTNIEEYMQNNVFQPLGMTSTTYVPAGQIHICERALKEVRRGDDGKLYAVKNPMYGLTTCASDFNKLLADLMASKSQILAKESVDVLFEPQLVPNSSALLALRDDTECYEYPAGIPLDMTNPPVNYTIGGLLAEDTLPLSQIPAGSVTWNGYPNVIFVMNRNKGLGMIFATQLAPVDDPKTVDLAMTFFREAWKTFGST
jgi:CubicO group peptidase (beta-lactamase class C family)